jgi:uncharacterized protein (DUF2147 family)
MKKLAFGLVLLLLITAAAAAQDVTGFWKTIDDETGKPKSVIALYTQQGKLYGRIILTYEDDGATIKDDMYRQKVRSPFLVGNPPFAGLDMIWDLTWDAGRKIWRNGSIMDPGNETNKPKIYASEIWMEGNNLIVRGKIAFIGRNQTWLRFDRKDFPAGFAVPDFTSFRAAVPRVK